MKKICIREDVEFESKFRLIAGDKGAIKEYLNTSLDMVYELESERNWPGLATETAAICRMLQVEDVNLTILDKKA